MTQRKEETQEVSVEKAHTPGPWRWMLPSEANRGLETALELLRRSIAASGLSTTAYARTVVLRRPREVRRWLDGSKPIPKSVARWLALNSPQEER